MSTLQRFPRLQRSPLGAARLCTASLGTLLLLLGAPSASAQRAPSWEWVQVLASPRIGGELTAVAVDPGDPQRIYVGTQSGTFLRSDDGALTWRELRLDPTARVARDVSGPPPAQCGSDCTSRPLVFVFTPFQVGTPASIRRLAPNVIRGLAGDGRTFRLSRNTRVLAPINVPVSASADFAFLRAAVRERETTPIRQIIVCPGSPVPLVVASEREVLGSNDGGITWIRLLTFPQGVQTTQIACDASRPGRLAIGSDQGFHESSDGGITLDPNLSGWPRNAVSTVHFSSDGTLWAASGFQLIRRSPGEREPRRVYPDFSAVETAPWEDIFWIDSDEEYVWFGTGDGVRRGRIDGTHFDRVSPTRLSRQQVIQVDVARLRSGARRMVSITRNCSARIPSRTTGCGTNEVLSSDDEGGSWHPFFAGITRRSIRQLAHLRDNAGRVHWLALTGGELWMTTDTGGGEVPAHLRRWAGQELRQTQPLEEVIEHSLLNLSLDRETVDGLFERAEGRGSVPSHLIIRVQMAYNGFDRNFASGPAPLLARQGDRTLSGILWVGLRWQLQEGLGVRPGDYTEAREALYGLRRRMSFAVEDAWHERVLHLRRLSQGFASPMQAAVLEQRVEVLDVLLNHWMGSSHSGISE